MIQKQELRAAIQAKTADATSRTVDVLFYSGAAVERFDWWTGEEYLLQFDMTGARLDRLNAGAPFLKDHWPSVDNTLGRSTKAWIENGNAFASFKLSETPDVDLVWSKIQNGTLTDVSMGVQIFDIETKEAKKGEKKLRIAKDWEPHEVSVVSIGADQNAGFLSDSSSDFLEHIAKVYGLKRVPPAVTDLSESGATGKAEGEEIIRLRSRARALSLRARVKRAGMNLSR